MYTGDLIQQLISTVEKTNKKADTLPATRRNSGAPGCYCSSLPAPAACDFCSGIRTLAITIDEVIDRSNGKITQRGFDFSAPEDLGAKIDAERRSTRRSSVTLFPRAKWLRFENMKLALVLPFLLCSLMSFAQVVTVPQGTAIRLRLAQDVSSADAHVGDRVNLDVLDDVTVENVVAIRHGAQAHGIVTVAHEKRRLGRAGAVAIRVESVQAADNSMIAVTASDRKSKGDNAAGTITTGVVGSVILFAPAAPLFLLKHGQDTNIPIGTTVDVSSTVAVSVDMANAPAIVVPVKVITPAPSLEHKIEGYTISDSSTSASDPGSTMSLGDAGRAARAKKAAEAKQ